MEIFTIGFTQTTAEDFFGRLKVAPQSMDASLALIPPVGPERG
jgi:hypothetical protein